MCASARPHPGERRDREGGRGDGGGGGGDVIVREDIRRDTVWNSRQNDREYGMTDYETHNNERDE